MPDRLTQIAFNRLCASGMVVVSFSLADGNDDQKKSFHSLSSCMYGMTLVSSRTQFNARKIGQKLMKYVENIINFRNACGAVIPACCSECVRQLVSTARTNRSVAL